MEIHSLTVGGAFRKQEFSGYSGTQSIKKLYVSDTLVMKKKVNQTVFTCFFVFAVVFVKQ